MLLYRISRISACKLKNSSYFIMDSFLTKEEVDGVRMKGESDEQWEIKKCFLLRHRSSYPKNRLLCLAQMFMNINFLGCVYNAELMREVNRLGDGIIKEVIKNRRKTAEGLMKVSEAKKPRLTTTTVPAETESPAARKRKVFVFLKAQSGVTDKGLEPLQRLNQIVARVKVGWQLKDVEGLPSLLVDDVLVLSNNFLALKSIETKQYAAAAALHAINKECLEIRCMNGRFELWHTDIGPKDWYLNYVRSLLRKAYALLPVSGSAQRRLEVAFRTAGTFLDYRTRQGKGWEEEISFLVMNILLGSKILRKGDCTKSKESEHREALASEIIRILSENEFTFEEKETGFTLTRKK